MGLTSAQRYNKNLHAIFDKAKSEGRGLVSDSKVKGVGVHSPAMEKAKIIGKVLNKKKNA